MMKLLFSLFLLLMTTVVMLSFYSIEFRCILMTQLMVNRIGPRIAAMFSTLTNGGSYLKLKLGEEDAVGGFRIPKPSSQFNESTDHDKEFQAWWARQQEMKENIRKVCEKFGHSLNVQVPLGQFMYDSNHKLLFCRNAKVVQSYI